MSGGLSPDQAEAFDRQGYLVLPGALGLGVMAGLLAETRRLLATFSLENHPLTRFTTGADPDNGGAGEEHVGDEYFLGSGDKIRFFFENDAFDPATGRLAVPKDRAINKIGHGLHMLSPPFAALLADRQIKEEEDAAEQDVPRYTPAAVARSLGFVDPRCLQSMVICKPAEIGGAVRPHQDSSFLYTNPPSAVGFWYALQDCTLENGCLSFLPGSHRWTAVSQRLVRRPAGVGTEMVDNTGPGFPAGEGYGEKGAEDGGGAVGEQQPQQGEWVPAEVSAGTLVLIHGNLLHRSERNLSKQGRLIYTFHVIEASGTTYDERNWLQPPDGGFSRLYREPAM